MLSDQLGSDTTEAMFKYIDNKTERSVEATIKTLATKDDIANLRKEIGDDLLMVRLASKDDISNLRKEMGDNFGNLYKQMGENLGNFQKQMGENLGNFQKQMGENRSETIKWMFIFWAGNFGAMLASALLIFKK